MKGGSTRQSAAMAAVVIALGACAPAQQAAPAAGSPAASGTPAAPSAQPSAAPAGQRTVMSGVFTADQGARGQRVFQTSCSACHTIAEMRGPAWQNHWNNMTLGQLHQFLSTQMPQDAPGSLSAQQYADIIAYLLRENGYPAGTAELQPTALTTIRFVPTP